jgi:uncharacterized protein (TIGR02391 family)
MNLESSINPELWKAIEASYESENYSHAIEDAMAFVTETLRDKSGIDGDGKQLVGKTLGFSPGKPPKIQLNKLETETEKNIQIGLREVLAGMYSLVRNPRSHESISDDKKSADAIIFFIDYLLSYLGESQASFTIDSFIRSVEDDYFVNVQDYVDALVQNIPIRKRSDVLIALYKNASWGKEENYSIVIDTMLEIVSDKEINDLLNVISNRLKTARVNYEVSLTRKIIPSDLWPRIELMARLRAENILLKNLAEAWYTPETDTTNGSAATWIKGIIQHFSLRDELQETLINLMYKEDFDYHNYVAKYFFYIAPRIYLKESDINRFTRAISSSLEKGNAYVKDKLLEIVGEFPSYWQESITKNLAKLTDPEKPELYLPDGAPLLGLFEESENPARIQEDELSTSLPEDEIPF